MSKNILQINEVQVFLVAVEQGVLEVGLCLRKDDLASILVLFNHVHVPLFMDYKGVQVSVISLTYNVGSYRCGKLPTSRAHKSWLLISSAWV